MPAKGSKKATILYKPKIFLPCAKIYLLLSFTLGKSLNNRTANNKIAKCTSMEKAYITNLTSPFDPFLF